MPTFCYQDLLSLIPNQGAAVLGWGKKEGFT